jgi:CheY-like chemotaxis protein
MPGTPEASAPQIAGAPYRVLLVEDSPEGRKSLARLLELHGFVVTAVADGQAAVKALHTDPPPQIVLTDLMLPDIDGREVARLARAVEPRPVVALTTGYSLADVFADSQENPADHVFLKPLDIRRVVELLRRSVENGPPK